MRRLALIALMLAACTSQPASRSLPSGATLHPVPLPTSRCVAVSQAAMDEIASGLNAPVTLGPGQAVRSKDFAKVWMVSADLRGESMEGRQIATWALNDLTGNASIFSVDGFAKNFSDWGPGPGFNLDDDGVSESQACVA